MDTYFTKFKEKLHRVIYGVRLKHAPFYRLYEYQSPVNLRKTDARGLVDLDLKIFYNRIPKAANSTVVASIAKNKFGHEFESHLDAKRKFPIHPVHLTKKQVVQFDTFFKFTFVRNPYTRVLSAYLDKILNGNGLINQLGNDPTFADFLTYLEYEGLHKNVHWAPQTSLFLIPISEFDYIGKVENIDADLPYVLQNIFSDPVLPEQTNYNRHSTDSLNKIADYYDEKTRRIVSSLYREDFDSFGYSHDI